MMATTEIEKALIALETFCVKADPALAHALNLTAAKARGELEEIEEALADATSFHLLAPKALILAVAYSQAITFCSCGNPNCSTNRIVREAVDFINTKLKVVGIGRGS